MGHIAHLRKQFKSINTYDYIITLIKRRKKNIIKLTRINWFFIWRNMNPYHPRMLVPRLVKLVQWFLRRGFFNFVNVFSIFRNYLPLEKGRALHLNKFESPSSKDALGQVWLKLAQWFWRRRFFLILSMYSRYFVIISPWKRAGPFIWTNLNPLHPRMLCAKFGWNWPCGSGEENFYNFVNVFFTIS